VAAYGAADRSSIPSVGRFLISATCGLAVGHKQSPIRWIQEALSAWVKWPAREVDQSPLDYVSVTISLHGIYLDHVMSCKTDYRHWPTYGKEMWWSRNQGIQPGAQPGLDGA
jgi:hypothetical protein